MATTNVAEAQPGDIFIDFAQELTPEIAAAAAAGGVSGIMQYTPYTDADRPKYGSAAEAQIAHDHGLYYMLNWEIEAARALQGYTVGRSDGARNRAALRAMGYPEQVSAPVSVDMNTLLTNKDQVSGFVRGHWETDGDQAENISYLDTDGGRVLDEQGLDPHIWIPGAFGWSPELYSLSRTLQAQGVSQADRYDQIAALAAQNPMAVAIQFPSSTAFGIRVDINRVLHPFNVWCAERKVDDKPTESVPVPPVSTTGDNDMQAFTHSDTYNGNPARWSYWVLMPDGTKRPLNGVELDVILQQRDTAPALDAGQLAQIPDWSPPTATAGSAPAAAAPRQFSGHIDSVPGTIVLDASA